MAEEMTRRRFVKIAAVAAGTLAAGGVGVKAATWAPEPELVRETIGAGMSKVLVAYATKSGSATEIAQRIGAKLAEAGATVDVKPVAEANASGYDAVVVGSGVRMGSWHAPAKEWVTANADALKSTPVAFFTVNLTITEPEKADEVRAYTDPLIESTGVKPVDVGLFAGWFEPKRFSFIERTVMKALKAPAGDHRDFPAVEAWAKATAPALGLRA